MQRKLFVILGIGLASLSYAQKADIIVPNTEKFQPGAGVGAMQILQMVVALVLVVGAMKLMLPKLVPMMSKRLNPNLGASIRIEETATFAGGNLYVVSARSKTLLLSCSQSGVQCLADLTQDNATSTADEPAFFELVDKAAATPVHAAAWIEDRATPPADPRKVQEALSRLQRLVS